ncbi:hypothetical protein BH10PSE18_BH10PSE18_07900 [soil metagenome]
MTNVSTRPHPKATVAEPASAPAARLASAPRSPIAFDSTAIDRIISRAEYIRGLASCFVCLSAMEKADKDFEGHELIDVALPSLGYVIMELATELGNAGDQLFEQYRQALGAANGTEYSA